jgi:hypothetical protein
MSEELKIEVARPSVSLHALKFEAARSVGNEPQNCTALCPRRRQLFVPSKNYLHRLLKLSQRIMFKSKEHKSKSN